MWRIIYIRGLFRHINYVWNVILHLVIIMKKVLVVIACACLVGGFLAYFIFNKIVIKDSGVENTKIVNAFQVGAFTNYDNALRVADRNNGIVVNEEKIYRVYVAILYDEDAVEKLSNYYQDIGLNYYLRKISVSSDFVDSISTSEELLIRSNSDTYTAINTSVLSKYEEML